MHGLWRCSGCLGLLALVMLTRPIEARPSDDTEDGVLWVEKSLNILHHVKRKAVCEQKGWSVCPKSAGGGCCPDNFACDKTSCYATTAGTQTCNGRIGWYACALTVGPGSCCPDGLICDSNGDCVPPPGVSASMSCSANYFNCPVSFGGGCCPNGMACGSGICYNGTPKTLPVSETRTTTDSSGRTTITVVTSLTTITEGPKSTSDPTAAAEIPQLIQSTVSKMPAIQTSESGSGHDGLSSGALGGIVAGVIVILGAIVTAAAIIVWRLKRAERAAKLAAAAAESGRESSNSQPRSHKAGFGQPSVSEIDTVTDVDPFNQFPIMRPSPDLRSRTATVVTGDRSPSRTPNFTNSGAPSPPMWGVPFNYVPSDAATDGRQSSLDSYPHHDNSNSSSRMSQRVSVESHGSYGHSRQPSDTSELEGPHGVSELATPVNNEAESRRRSNSASRPTKGHVRRNSDLSAQNRSRGDSNATTGPLGTVNEIYELHGHYGPLHAASGQTAARLGRGSSSVSEAPSHPDP